MFMKKIGYALLLCCFFSCEEIINEEDITARNMILLAPTTNSTIAAGAINFSWQTVNGAVEYNLQVATPSFANATQIVLDTTMSTTNFNYMLETNNYEWRVKALNSGYETGYTTNAFQIIEAP